MSTNGDRDEDPPVLVDLPTLRATAVRNIDVFVRLALKYAEDAETHIEYLVKLLALKGVHCSCTGSTADPQCLIHVHENLPDD